MGFSSFQIRIDFLESEAAVAIFELIDEKAEVCARVNDGGRANGSFSGTARSAHKPGTTAGEVCAGDRRAVIGGADRSSLKPPS
jgi:hypothetical protein